MTFISNYLYEEDNIEYMICSLTPAELLLRKLRNVKVPTNMDLFWLYSKKESIVIAVDFDKMFFSILVMFDNNKLENPIINNIDNKYIKRGKIISLYIKQKKKGYV